MCAELTRKDRQRLRGMVTAVEKDEQLVLEVADAVDAIARLRLAASIE